MCNRTAEPLVLRAQVDDAPATELVLPAGDSKPVFGIEKLTIQWREGGEDRLVPLTPGCAYEFNEREAQQPPVFEQIGLRDAGGPPLVLPGGELLAVGAPTLKVKAFVDDDELRRPAVWQPVLRARIAAASDVLEAHCGVRLQLVGFGTWDSDDFQHDFERSLAEFERETNPGDADVAIGFSSQYAVQVGRFHMGGTRAPLYSHIMIKERARGVLETERLELLVHELGHLLGASHSPEPTSVMRPVITGGLQRHAGAHVQFDPVNTLAMSLVADEMRLRRIHSLSDATAATRRRLTQLYASLDPTLPNDPAAGIYQQLVGSAAGGVILEDARKILAEIDRVAKLDWQHAVEPVGAASGVERLPASDQRLEWIVRQAAAAALRVRKEHAEKAFLLALGSALDDRGMLASLPMVAVVERNLTPASARAPRAEAIGEATMRGRADLPKHFFVSAHLVVILGSDGARHAGVLKELADANGGSGFSFVDMTANRAGIVFAHAVLLGRVSLRQVAREFTVEGVLPQLDDLSEGMQAAEFAKRFGGLQDARFEAELVKIEQRVAALPFYRSPTAGK